MPRASEFRGIVIAFYFEDHPPPHFHVWYSGQEASVSILSGKVTDGDLPKRVAKLVRQWAEQHRAELYANWRRAGRDLHPNWIEPPG